jgi:hypothetical protein
LIVISELLVDVTTIVKTQILNQAAIHPHYACDYRYGVKMTKHGEPCKQAGMVFIAMVVQWRH